MTYPDYCYMPDGTLRNETALKLIEALEIYFDEDDFIVGVLSNAYHDDDRNTLLSYIEEGKDVTYESIILLSLELGMQRDDVD